MLRFGSGAVLALPQPGVTGTAEWGRVCLAAAAWFLATVYVYLVNGVEDALADQVNRVGRPIGRGDLDPTAARTVAQCCAVAALVLATGCEPWVVVTTAGYLLLGHLYSVPPARLNATPLGSLAVVLGGVSLTYATGALAVGGGLSGDGLTFAVVMTLWATLIGATVKDLSDLRGDAASGRRPLAARLPPTLVHRGIAVVAASLGAALCVAATDQPSLRLPGAAALGGAAVVTYLLLTTIGAPDRARARRPYRAFMVTQFAVHLLLLADRLVPGQPV